MRLSDVRDALAGEASDRLQAVARAALDEPEAVLRDWSIASLSEGPGMLASERSLYLVAGTARCGTIDRPWRAVLKVVATDDEDDASRIRFWKREALLYRSGFLHALPGGLRAPRCYGCEEQGNRTLWLWLEHVGEDGEPVWPLARWALAARHLGQFNGAYLAGRPLPRAPWLGGRRLSTWLEGHVQHVQRIAAAPLDREVRQWWPGPVVEAILRLWQERANLCAGLERLPQTFCHGDAIRRNLFACRSAGGAEETVAIDWEYAGYMAAGEEVGQTLSVAGAFFDVDPAGLPALDGTLFAGYVDGLRQAGWRGDQREVRFAYTAHAALRNLFNAVGTSRPDEAGRARVQQRWGHSWQELAERRAEVRPYLLTLADEARALLQSL